MRLTYGKNWETSGKGYHGTRRPKWDNEKPGTRDPESYKKNFQIVEKG